MPLLCTSGFHKWKWMYLKQNSCDVQLVCTRCRKTSGAVEVKHQWNKAYIKSDSCEMQETCPRCGATTGPINVVHEWEWIPRNPCIAEQVCKRCGATGQIDEKEHLWRKIYSPNSCEIRETCERCGASRIPLTGLTTFVGQETIKPSLIALIAAVQQKGEPLHHLLLCGQPGMGKTTLAQSIADEIRCPIRIVSGKAVPKAGDLAAILTSLRQGELLLIQQIESMRKPLVEVLVPAIADLTLDIIIGKGPSVRSIRLRLPHFTLIGTTSKPSQVDERLNSLMFAFDLAAYDVHEISQIIPSLAKQQGITIDSEAADLLAEYCNGCPGEASVLLKKAHEYAVAYAAGHITPAIVRDALAVFGPKSSSPSRERQPIPNDVRVFVWQRDGGRCVKCGSQENLEYDHIIPVSKGGSNTARNIQLLCEKCNRSKSVNIA